MKKLFVGNLPYQASEADLETWFTTAGLNVSTVSIVRDRFSGEPRGFGFVEIEQDEEAEKAINNCNGQDLLGRTLVVNEARPTPSGGVGANASGGISRGRVGGGGEFGGGRGGGGGGRSRER